MPISKKLFRFTGDIPNVFWGETFWIIYMRRPVAANTIIALFCANCSRTPSESAPPIPLDELLIFVPLPSGNMQRGH